MTQEIRNGITVIIADDGKVFRRIGTEEVFGHEIYLGKSYYINGEKLERPHDDVPEDFEEIDSTEPRNLNAEGSIPLTSPYGSGLLDNQE